LQPHGRAPIIIDVDDIDRSALKPVTWGVLGAANIALTKVVPGMQKGRLSRVVAIASRSAEKARSAAESSGIPSAYGSYEALLDDLEAGKHVLCEKPIALTAAEAVRLRDAAAGAGVLVGEAFMVRAHPQWFEVKRLIETGRIGALQLMHGHFSYGRRDPHDVRSRREYGGGVLLDIGCYPINIARWMFGREPVAAVAAIDRDRESGVDLLTSGMLRFHGGQATFSSAGQLVNHQRVQLFGERAWIDVETPFTASPAKPARIFVYDGNPRGADTAERIDLEPVDQYTLQGDRFSSAIRGVEGAHVPCSIEDAVANMMVIDALFRSAETGRWEKTQATAVGAVER